MSRARLIILTVLLLVSSKAFAQESTYSDFEEFVELIEGRWIGEITWIADWPGMGNRGDKVTGYMEMNAVADGRILLGSSYGGNGTNRWMIVFNAASGEIRSIGADSGGTMGECVVSKQEGQWTYRCAGSLADGTSTEAETRLTVSDNGNTLTWTGRVTIGGEDADPLNDVWRRVGR